MKLRVPIILIVVMCSALLGASCQKGKVSADLRKICDAEKLSGDKNKDRVAHQLAISNWISEKLETESARRVYSDLFNTAPKERIAKLRAEAKRGGIGDCMLANSWERELKEDGK